MRVSFRTHNAKEKKRTGDRMAMGERGGGERNQAYTDVNWLRKEYYKILSYQKAFEYADKEVKGTLTKHRYKIAMTAVFGYCPDKMEVQCVFKSHANDISYEEFEYWVSKKYHGNSERISGDTLFALLDNNYKGRLVLEDFCSASKRADLKISTSIWEKVFKEWDQYKRGYIDLEQFLFIFDSLQNGSK